MKNNTAARDSFATLYESIGHSDKADGTDENVFGALIESATDNAKKSLDAIIGVLAKGDNAEMKKMAKGINDYFKKEGSFSPDQAKWIWKTSVAMFKKG